MIFETILFSSDYQPFQSDTTGNQTFNDYLDNIYTARIGIGTPTQQFELVLDTGSSNVWVADKSTCTSTNCKQAGPLNRTMFNKTASSTFHSSNVAYNQVYGAGSISGIFSTDVLELIGTNIQIPNQQFLLAYQIDNTFGETPIDGIVGMSWQTLSNITPPIINLAGILAQPIFTVYLEKQEKENIVENGGFITYGAIDTTNCNSNIKYVPLSGTNFYWQFDLDGVRASSYETTTKQQAISDTGTSFLAGPEDQIVAIAKLLNAVTDDDGYLYIECDKANGLPNIVFTIGGIPYPIPPSQYVMENIKNVANGVAYCMISMMPLNIVGGPDWILGDTFIRSYCNIYDIGKKRIGFATNKYSPENNKSGRAKISNFILFPLYVLIFYK